MFLHENVKACLTVLTLKALSSLETYFNCFENTAQPRTLTMKALIVFIALVIFGYNEALTLGEYKYHSFSWIHLLNE